MAAASVDALAPLSLLLSVVVFGWDENNNNNNNNKNNNNNILIGLFATPVR